jgi:diguanylate cyclase (GGDEF)-like protein
MLVARDITERKRVQEQLEYDAFHDAMTGLPNRALFLDRLGRAIERAHRRPQDASAVLFLDLDRFKMVNDSLGHAAGDRLLVSFARRLETLLRSSDTAARLGGDEFVILITDKDEAFTENLVKEIKAECEQLADYHIKLSMALGYAGKDEKHNDLDSVLKLADGGYVTSKSRFVQLLS